MTFWDKFTFYSFGKELIKRTLKFGL